jgi:hypothetical protein
VAATLVAIGVHRARRDLRGETGMGIGTLRSTFAAALFAAALVAASGTAASAAAPSPSLVEGCFFSGSTRICNVNEPVVNEPSSVYNIQFNAGDRVTVNAGGCVQTGGRGKTWKRYVDPSSSNGLYHGTMFLPGVTSGLTELRFLVGNTYTLTAGGSLFLGYEDDNYTDNGYYSHDDGTNDQCKNVGNAFVSLTIN